MNVLGYKEGPISCKKQAIKYIKSYIMIDVGSIKCYMDIFVTDW